MADDVLFPVVINASGDTEVLAVFDEIIPPITPPQHASLDDQLLWESAVAAENAIISNEKYFDRISRVIGGGTAEVRDRVVELAFDAAELMVAEYNSRIP